MKRKPNKMTAYALLLIVALLLFFILRTEGADGGSGETEDLQEITYSSEEAENIPEAVSASEEAFAEPETAVETEGSGETVVAAETESTGDDNKDLAKDGIYTSKEEVALYIHVYGELPDNYISKKEAKALGWEGGSLEAYAPGKMIGGDRFGNYEGILPEEGNYTECDIDTMGKKSRGAKRLVYDDAGNIYYTEDHYESFTQLYDADGPVE